MATEEIEVVPKEVQLCFEKMKSSGKFKNVRFIAEANLGLNSRLHRFWKYDRKLKRLTSSKVAHGSGGKNKTPHDGRCRQVSNLPGSNMSCLGLFKMSEVYDGPHGDSLRLDGMESTNSNARKRGIVFHRSDYVHDSDNEISGRSLGCPAKDRKNFDRDLQDFRDGSPLYLHYNGKTTV